MGHWDGFQPFGSSYRGSGAIEVTIANMLKSERNTKEEVYHYIFIISQLRLTSHPRSTVVLLDTETPGTSREIYSEDADGETRTRNPWITNPVL